MGLTRVSGDILQSSINIGVVTASQVNVGSAVTIHSGGFQVGGSDLHSSGLTVQNLNSTGVVTATSFSGNLTGNLTGNVNSTGVSTFSTLKVGTGVTISGGIVTATSFSGSGANLTGIAVTANVVTNSLVVSGMTTATGGIQVGVTTSLIVGDTFVKRGAVGLGTTSTTGRNAGVGTATGTIIYNSSTSAVEVYTGSAWVQLTVTFSASGGTEDTSTRSGYKVHTFTGSGELRVNGGSKTAEILVIGGGGGGTYSGGGAGALIYKTGIPLVPGPYTITIGSGGAGEPQYGPPTSPIYGPDGSGVQTTAFGYTAAGGGGGGYPQKNPGAVPGGSGGGGFGATAGSATGSPGGSANTASPDSGWGNPGGSNPPTGNAYAGGGGAGGVGGNSTYPGGFPHGAGGNGGNGLAMSITGVSVTRAGGGGGGAYAYPPSTPLLRHGAGGPGGGGTARTGYNPAMNGTSNTGSGGGAPYGGGGNGGSGVVIVAYPTT